VREGTDVGLGRRVAVAVAARTVALAGFEGEIGISCRDTPQVVKKKNRNTTGINFFRQSRLIV